MDTLNTRRQTAWTWTIASTLVAEAITVACRAATGFAAADIPDTTHWLLRLHHMFWCVPLLAVLPFVWRFERVSGVLTGLSVGLILSDLIHHFVVLPLCVGNTGWHWP